MIIHCRKDIATKDFQNVLKAVEKAGLKSEILREANGMHHAIIGVRGDCAKVSTDEFLKLQGVESVQRIGLPYKLASRDYRTDDTIITINGIMIGKGYPTVFMAGPCAVESEEQIVRIAQEVKNYGASILRGGAWKPRTYSRTYEGLKEEGLLYLAKARELTGLPIVTEVTSPELVELIGGYADILQVGTRNMQNFDLLDELGKQEKPVMLKRGMVATIDEFLGAADRIMEGGNNNVMLCLRGVRTFDTTQRYPADLYAIPYLRERSHLPILFDPSHAAGKRSLVPALARMAIAAGVDGLLIETHYNPAEALCDGAQMITPDEFGRIVKFARNLDTIVKDR